MIHNISYRVFVYGTENEEKVKETIKALFPYSNPHKEVIEGYFKNLVLVLSDKIEKRREIKDFMKLLKNLKPSAKKRILNELDMKIDSNGNLFLRFDKQLAYLDNLKIIEHGDAVHVKINIAAYPARKETAMEIAERIFG